MGLLIDGKWTQDEAGGTDQTGRFQRPASVLRNWITPDGAPGPSGEGGFGAEAGRYHLYVSLACPWAHRALIFRKLKGLEGMISLSVVNWFMGEEGWSFAPGPGVIPDPIFGARVMHEVYGAAHPDYTGRVTVPVLFDRKTRRIVNNESSQIIRMFNSAFDGVGAAAGDYYPVDLRGEIDALNERVYATLNNGVYRAGFASTQAAYEEAVWPLFDTLDMLEERLATRRYLCGARVTEATYRGAPSIVWLTLLFAAALVAFNSVFVVDQREEAVVLQLGQPVRVVHAGPDGPGLQLAPGAGLHFKIPFMQKVITFDRRNQALEVDQEEVTTSDQQKLVVDAFLRYRISEPLQYYRALRDETIAHDQLQRLLNSSLRQVLGDTNQQDIISGRRDQLMQASKVDVARRAKANGFGVEIIDLRIKRADLPAANQASVYKRMQTSRQQIAFQYRAEGEQQKREIMATADKDVTVTLANARQTGETTRGQGDAIRTRLFAESFGKDPAFAKLYRSLQAYEKGLGQGDTTMILSPDDNSFFDVFVHGPGGGGGKAAPKR